MFFEKFRILQITFYKYQNKFKQNGILQDLTTHNLERQFKGHLIEHFNNIVQW